MTKRKTENGTEVTDLAAISNDAAAVSAAYVEAIDRSWLEGVTIERIVPLQDGQGVRGRFMGEGPPVEVSDPVTGEVRPLGTWRIEVAPGIVIRLLDSARLKTEFRTLPADGTKRVRVMRLGSNDTRKGRRVTDYIVGIEKDAQS